MLETTRHRENKKNIESCLERARQPRDPRGFRALPRFFLFPRRLNSEKQPIFKSRFTGSRVIFSNVNVGCAEKESSTLSRYRHRG